MPICRSFTILCLLLFASVARAADTVSFSREIMPILSDNCLACHGHDEKTRKAGLRLDIREGALAKNKEGIAAIIPGKPDESELIKRVLSDDADDLMPPPKSHKRKLDAAQVETLKRWIAQGRKDATLRALWTGLAIAVPGFALYPVMPGAELAIAMQLFAFTGQAMAAAAGPASITLIAPGQIKSQATALYYLCIGVFGQLLGPPPVGLMTDLFGESGVAFIDITPLTREAGWDVDGDPDA